MLKVKEHLRLDRLPHIWCPGCGNGTVAKSMIQAIQKLEYDKDNIMAPWTIKTKFSNDVNLTFKPFFQRTAKADRKLVRSEVLQLFGYFNGTIQLPDDSVLQIRQMLGSSDEHYAKW